jgi:hypothetical protein
MGQKLKNGNGLFRVMGISDREREVETDIRIKLDQFLLL